MFNMFIIFAKVSHSKFVEMHGDAAIRIGILYSTLG